jgi:hypothetical protein
MKPLLMIWDVRQRSVEHLAHWMWELWPLRNLSSGGTMTEEDEENGIGVGVGLLVNGLDDKDDCVDVVEAVVSVEPLLSVLD